MGLRPLIVASALSLLVAGGVPGRAADVVMPARSDPGVPAVAIGTDGAQLLAATGRSGSGFAVLVRSRHRAGGPWSPIAAVSEPAAERPLGPLAATDGVRDVVVWRSPDGRVRSAVRAGPSGRWSTAVVASGATGFEAASLALGTSGATVAWAEGGDPAARVRRARMEPVTGVWREEEALAVSGSVKVAAGSGGHVAAAWAARSGGPVHVATAPPGGSWQVHTPGGADGLVPAVSVSPAGAVAAAWQETDPAHRVRILVRPPGASSWPAPEDIGEAGIPWPAVAVSDTADAIVAWLAPGAGSFALTARRRIDGSWGPPAVLARPDLTGSETPSAAVDALGNSFVAWVDAEGPGTASLRTWVWPRPASGPLGAASFGVGGDEPRFSLGVAGGDGIVASARSLAVGTPALDTDVAAAPVRAQACAAPPARRGSAPGEVVLSPAQLRINQRISSAAIRRAQAVEAWLDGRIRAGDLCGGGIVGSVLGAGVALGAPATSEPLRTSAPRPLVIRPAAERPSARFALTTAQLRINQRISSHAVRLANALADRLDAGLSGGDLAPGAVVPAAIARTIGVTRTADVPPPPPTRTRVAPATSDPSARFTLSASQLRINQRISQAAVRRVNAIADRLATGLTASEFQASTVTGALLPPPEAP